MKSTTFRESFFKVFTFFLASIVFFSSAVVVPTVLGIFLYNSSLLLNF